VLGFTIGLTVMVLLLNAIGWANPRHFLRRLRQSRSSEVPDGPAPPADYWDGVSPRRINNRFRRLQILSAAYMALSHGSNDAQKTMGIITGVLVTTGYLHKFQVPVWVIAAAGAAIGLGTLSGGWRIVHTVGSRITKLRPRGGFCAETAAAISILAATWVGVGVSTTHVITGAITGVGSIQRFKAVRWGVATNIVWAWGLTIPAAAAVAWISYSLLYSAGLDPR
jgi:PiT family inorganic phosphate transporter